MASMSLNELTVVQLRDRARTMGLTGYSRLRKKELVALLQPTKPITISDLFTKIVPPSSIKRKATFPTEFELSFLKLRKDGADLFIRIGQLGKPGKEGTVFLVSDPDTLKQYALKSFRKTKSGRMIEREAYLQYLASKEGISPKIIAYNTEEKFIVMDMLHRTLMDILKEQKGVLTMSQQTQIIGLYQKLDKIGIMLNDANPLNIMEKDNRLYAIDYGFAKFTGHKDFKNYSHPNFQLMPVGLLLWLKDYYPISNLTYIKSCVDPGVAAKLELHKWP